MSENNCETAMEQNVPGSATGVMVAPSNNEDVEPDGDDGCGGMVIDLQEQSQPTGSDQPPQEMAVDGTAAEAGPQQPIIVQPAETHIMSHQEQHSGSTIAQTLQGLVSPGSTVYGTNSQVLSQQVADCSGATGSQPMQFAAPQLPPPVAILSPVDQRQMAQLSTQRPGTPNIGSVSSATAVSRTQQAMCHYVQQSPQGGIMAGHETALQNMISPGTAIYGAGTQIMCSAETAVQSQMDVAMACHQQYIGSATIQTGTGFQTPVMALPQTLQVIQAAPHQFVQQQCLQQQYMFQANPIQTLQSLPTAVSMSAPRPVSKSPSILPIAPQSASSARVSSAPASMSAKGTAAVAPQPAIYVSKSQSHQPQHQQQQAQNTSVVIGQLAAAGVMQNTNIGQQTILPQQPRTISLCQVQQPLNLGQIGQQLQFAQPLNLGPVNQSLNFGPAGQQIALGQVNQTLNLSQVNQVIGNSGQIRFATMPNFGFNAAGQLVQGGPTVVNFQNVPLMQQQMLTSQPATILSSQPLYIRTGDPFVQQQTPAIAVANVQAVTPIRNVVVPQTVTSSQPRRLQVQPNNAIAPSSSANRMPTTTTAAITKSSPKLSKPHPNVSVAPPRSLVPASAGLTSSSVRPVKPTMSVAVLPKPQLSTPSAQPSAVPPSIPATVCPTVANSMPTPVCVTTSVPTTVPAPAPVPTSTAPVTASVIPCVASVPAVLSKNDSVAEPKPADSAVKPSVMKQEIADRTVDAASDKAAEKSMEAAGEDTGVSVVSAKISAKSKKPKILTHVIEGFIIQEASEPFPVQGSSLISQLWAPKVLSTTDDGYSSPKSERDSEDGDDDANDDKKQTEGGPSKKPRLDYESNAVCKKEEPPPQPQAPAVAPPAPPAVITPAAQVDPRLTCEFCGKRDFANNLTRSRRFCSVTCSKRFSAYSMRKTPDGSVIGRPLVPPGSGKRRSVVASPKVQPQANALPTTDVKEITATAQPAPRLAEPRIAAIKGTTTNCTSESEDTEMSSIAGAASHTGDSSSASQSPPALERVERVPLPDRELSEDGVLIPPRPLAQWGVQDVYDFIRTLPGCNMYADEFRQQEIDGSALMLLKEDHLMMTMNVKLGPALKICSRISSLKE